MTMTTTRSSNVDFRVTSPESMHRRRGLWLNLPEVSILLLWSVIPVVMTLWFSFRRYNLMDPARSGFDRLGNYRYRAFAAAIQGSARLSPEEANAVADRIAQAQHPRI